MQPAGQLDQQGQGRGPRARQPLAVVTGAGRGFGEALARDLAGQARCRALHSGKLATGMGQADAVKPPGAAVRELLELLESDERRSPRFVSLGAPDLDW